MSITIKDIAKFAEVSTSTVSLVISGKGYVSKTTRAKVQGIIDEYNYRPLRSAQQLASNQTGNIGFIISDIHLSRSEAFYSRILLGAELEARNHNMYLLLSTVAAKIEIPQGIPRFLNNNDVDGIIIAGSVPVDLVYCIRDLQIPTVLIDFGVNGANFDSVLMDNRSGVQQIINHLISNDITKIGFVGGSFYHPSVKERFEGYQIAMVNNNLGHIAQNEDYHYLIDHETSVECGDRGLAILMKKIPDLEAVICVNDTTATGCLRYLKRTDKSAPRDIKIAGFDDVNFSAFTNPPLTTVNVPKVQMGVEGMKLLLDRLQNGISVHQTRLIPVELVVRESTFLTNKIND